MSLPNPRRISLDVLDAVLRKGRPLDEAFSSDGRLSELSSRDRAFVRLLVTTVIRRLGEIDAVLASFLERPLRGKRERLQDVLRLGTAQLLFLETPPHAAVATSVALAKAAGFEGLAGLVNAVLRRVGVKGSAILKDLDLDKLALPGWLWNRLVQTYGEAETRAITQVQRSDPPIDLTLRDPDTADEWAQKLDATRLPNGSLRLSRGAGDIRQLAGFAEGAWWVQDAAASLPARLLAPQPGEVIADLCSAPGGKTLQLAAAGAEVFAVELHPKRLELVQENLVRTQLSAACVVADASLWQPPESLNGVLLDAPCSATGTLRRHPDVALHRRPDELEKLVRLQDCLLENAAKLVKQGGRLVYSVCSLLPEEGPARISAFLNKGAPFRVEAVAFEDFGLPREAADETGGLRTQPSFWGETGGMDGFYMCRLRRL